MQHEILFIHGAENNRESETHYEANLYHFSRQGKLVFDLLMSGKEITSMEAMIKHQIVHLARRIKDLEESKVAFSDRWDGRHKVWFMTPENINQNKTIYEQTKRGKMES